MPTQYLTFILRVRLESVMPSQEESPEHRLSGSLQQAGSEHIAYFDSPQKLKEVLAQTLPLEPDETTPSE
ncbi:MAG: hypothetical protein HUU38_23900 [Anaerolineales bacterium]|nr:hypothetical protein [Anaerolineales bacterium]